MRTTKPLIFAIVALLPFGAFATGPAHDSGNSPVVATASAPYQTVTPEAHADEHIASTKYVIGAYNDAIAAVNKVNADKQEKLVNDNDDPILPDVINDGGAFLSGRVSDVMTDNVDSNYYHGFDVNRTLLTAEEIVLGIADVVQSQRVKIYTTWEDDSDNATSEVSLLTAQQ